MKLSMFLMKDNPPWICDGSRLSQDSFGERPVNRLRWFFRCRGHISVLFCHLWV